MAVMYEGMLDGQPVMYWLVGGGASLGVHGAVGCGEHGQYVEGYGQGMGVREGLEYHGHGMPGGRYGHVLLDEARAEGKEGQCGAVGVKCGRFTREDDEKIVELKGRGLSWKQIAGYFPGRSAGSLQVHFCTKLRRREGEWSQEMVGCCLELF